MSTIDDRASGYVRVGRDGVAPGPAALPAAAVWAAAVISITAWAFVFGSRAHLLHFDAKAHLVVSRRVFDNLTPGWSQLGAIWLPLPHILNALPAQTDFLYHSGLFAGALGLLSFVAGVAALSVAAARVTGERWAGVVASKASRMDAAAMGHAS